MEEIAVEIYVKGLFNMSETLKARRRLLNNL